MANTLINGAAAAEVIPPPEVDRSLIPTWGYHSSGDAKIFNLKPGEDLPSGWAHTPAAYKPASAATPNIEPGQTVPKANYPALVDVETASEFKLPDDPLEMPLVVRKQARKGNK